MEDIEMFEDTETELPADDVEVESSLTPEHKQAIEEICDYMIDNLDPEVLGEILMEPAFSEDGILSNDEFYEDERLFDVDDMEMAEYAKKYLMDKLGGPGDEMDYSDDELNLESLAEMLNGRY